MSKGTKGVRSNLLVQAARAAGALALLLAMWTSSAGVVHANRFGPPWQIRVISDQAIVYARPDTSSEIIGPLQKGAIAILTGETQGADGTAWVSIIDGYLPASDVVELNDEWMAEVTAPSVSVYAKPNAGSAIRRTAQQGDLLRVTGASPGLEGDTSIWWSTTEGYVHIRTLKEATGKWAQEWTLPQASQAPSGWWGVVVTTSNVRAGATTEAPIVGMFQGGEQVKVLAEEQGQAVSGNSTWYRIDGGRYAGARVHSSLIRRIAQPQPTMNTLDGSANQYITVNRAARTLTLVENGQPVFTTYVAIGQAGADTPTGRYSTFGKFRADDMTSLSIPDAGHSYDLPNVPFTQYYKEGGYAIHGTYWHDLFGTRQSQGCINVTYADSAYLFERTHPQVPQGSNEAWANGEATLVVILD